MSTISSRPRRKAGEPAWEIAMLFPNQGYWSEEEYLALDTNHLVEYADGFIEVLPMPTQLHQLMVAFLYRQLLTFVEPRELGRVLFAPMRVRLRKGKYREPDVLFMLTKHAARMGNEYWEGADLVMEVISPGDENRERDLKEKRKEYARARIREYWIIDPAEERVLVLRLRKGKYVVHGTFGRGETAASALLDGFAVDVNALLDAK
jgi:Uma2 family endonuclease